MRVILRMSFLILLAVASLSPLAHGQGCTMCYTAAAQQSAQGKHALDVGILMLLMPAIGMFCGLFFFVWRSKEPPNSVASKSLGLNEVSVVDWERAADNEEALQSWPNERY